MSEILKDESMGAVTLLTLNRPEAKNAIDDETNALLWEIWADFAADDSVDVATIARDLRIAAAE